jgi:NAD(P)-dependent dehydrogenase (short-subunit alcohol dehydrogenase family)
VKVWIFGGKAGSIGGALAARYVAEGGHDVLALGRTPCGIAGVRDETFDLDRPGEDIAEHVRRILIAEGEGFDGEDRDLALLGGYRASWRRFWMASKRGAPDLAILSSGIGAYLGGWQWHDERWNDSRGASHAGVSTIIRVNLTSRMWVANELIRSMRRRRDGKIVLIGSRVATRGSHALEVYAASHAGMRGYVLSASRHPGKRGVTVGLVEPGWTATPMTRDLAPHIRDAIDQHLGKMLSADEAAMQIAASIETLKPGEIVEVGN